MPSSFSSMSIQIAKHEVLVTGKVSCLTFAVQLVLQLLPLESTTFLTLTWALSPLLLVLGFISDFRFYSKNSNDSTRKEQITCTLILTVTSWLTTFCFFQYLKLPLLPDRDNEAAEKALPGLGTRLVLHRIFEDFGYFKGIILLLGTHFAAVATLVSSLRTTIFCLEFGLRKLATLIPKMSGERERKKKE